MSLKPLLILSTCAYPDPFVRAIRTTQLARYLPEFGYKPIIYTRYYGHEAAPDEVAANVHPEAEIHHLDKPADLTARTDARKNPSLKQRLKLAAARVPITKALVVPDLGIKFWRDVRPRALGLVREHSPVAVFTNAPPISNHDIGLDLKRRTGLPWIADYEDPSLIDKRFGPFGLKAIRRRDHEAYERAIYTHADLITHVIPIHERWARMRYPDARPRIRGLTMACPPELAAGTITPDRADRGCRSVRVVGFMGDDEVLALARAIAGLVRTGHDLELRLIGRTPGTIDQIKAVLGDRAVATGFIPHAKALEQIAGADLLVSYLSPERSTHLLLSSKLFEFIAAGKPTIEINPTRSDRLFLRSIPGITTLRLPTQQQLADAIDAALTNNTTVPESVRQDFATNRNWRAQAQKLATWIDDIS